MMTGRTCRGGSTLIGSNDLADSEPVQVSTSILKALLQNNALGKRIILELWRWYRSPFLAQ